MLKYLNHALLSYFFTTFANRKSIVDNSKINSI